MKEKDVTIDKQTTEITNLRKKNFDFRAKLQNLEEKKENEPK